jgi:hypothetical protein
MSTPVSTTAPSGAPGWKSDALWGALCAGILGVTVAGAGWPMLRPAPEPSPAADAQAVKADLTAAEKEQSKLRADLRHAEAELAGAVTLRPAGELYDLLHSVATMAEECGVELQRTAPGKTEPHAGRVTVQSVSLAGTGTYASILRFVDRLHDARRDTRVNALTIQAAPSRTPAKATFTMDFAWYAVGAGPAAPAPK